MRSKKVRFGCFTVQGTRVPYSLPQRTDVKHKQSKFDRVYTRSRCTGSISTAHVCVLHICTPDFIAGAHRRHTHGHGAYPTSFIAGAAMLVRSRYGTMSGNQTARLHAVQSCCRSWVETTRARASSAPCPVRAHLSPGTPAGSRNSMRNKMHCQPCSPTLEVPSISVEGYVCNFASIIGVLFI